MEQATYHVSVWGDAPEYICLICSLGGMTEADVKAHLATEHQAEAVPSVAVAHLLAIAGHKEETDA